MERRKRRGREEWSRIIGEQKQSGLSAVEFCRRDDIGISSFHQWKRRLADVREGEAESVRDSFIDMGRVGVSERSVEVPEARVGSFWEATLELGNGVRLNLRRG
jgi:putative transposase